MGNRLIKKSELRQILLKKRKAIPEERRREASQKALFELKNRGRLLSFSPFGSEIDLGPLNLHLERMGHLRLVPYKIEAFFEVSLTDIDCILVPGLGFDKDNFRIGYGKGAYDQFLAKTGDIWTIGVGFKEQFYEGSLPKDPWDIPVKEVLLF